MRAEETIEAPTMGQRVTWLARTASTGGELLRFEFWMRGGASPPPLHVHPRQEERIEVVSGSVRSISEGVERVLGPGEAISTPPGEPHTVGPAGDEGAEMIVEFRPALGFEGFVERTFALDRAGHLDANGRGNPLRVATARPHDAEFFLPRVPVGLQRTLLRTLDRLGRRLRGGSGCPPSGCSAHPHQDREVAPSRRSGRTAVDPPRRESLSTSAEPCSGVGRPLPQPKRG